MTDPDQTLVFTAHERRVLRLAAQGLTDRVAGRRIGACARTYRRHLVAVSAKLGARNRAHAAALAVAFGLIDGDDLEPRQPVEHLWPVLYAEPPLRSPIGERPRLKSGHGAGSTPAGGTP